MKQNIVKLVLVISSVLLFSPLCFAGILVAAAKYEVKITKFELKNSSTGDWVTAYTGVSSALDIASGAAGQSVGNFLSGLEVPDGTYATCKVTVSKAFKIRGTSGSYHTTAETTIQPIDGRTVSVASTSGSAADCDTLVLDTDVTAQEKSFSAITITNGIVDHKIRVSFDVSAALEFGTLDNGIPFFCPKTPTITVTSVDL